MGTPIVFTEEQQKEVSRLAEEYRAEVEGVKIARSRNSKPLLGFITYCQAHPEERFWQALRNWCGWPFVYAAGKTNAGEIEGADLHDTFNWE